MARDHVLVILCYTFFGYYHSEIWQPTQFMLEVTLEGQGAEDAHRVLLPLIMDLNGAAWGPEGSEQIFVPYATQFKELSGEGTIQDLAVYLTHEVATTITIYNKAITVKEVTIWLGKELRATLKRS